MRQRDSSMRRRRRRAAETDPQPRMRQGDSGISARAPAHVTIAGSIMLPVPRITFASELKSQTRMAPPKRTFE